MTISEEILVNITPQETRVAVVENGVLQEVSIERQGSRGIVGNIYKLNLRANRVPQGPCHGGDRWRGNAVHRR